MAWKMQNEERLTKLTLMHVFVGFWLANNGSQAATRLMTTFRTAWM